MIPAARWCVMLIVVAMVLVGCGEEAEQRRFATDDQPTFVAASPSIGVTPRPLVSPSVVAVFSPEALMASAEPEGAAFLQRPDGVWAVDIRSGEGQRIYAAPNGVPVFIASAGDRVAILAGGERDGEQSTLTVLDAAGNTLQQVDGIEAVFADTTGPVTPVSVDWHHEGARLLVGFRGGGLLDVPLEGEPSVILGSKRVPYLEEARWSPSSDMIAYVGRSERDGPGRLFVAKPRGGATDPVALAPANNASGQSVRSVAWADGGEAILYVQTSSASVITGQDLFAVAPSGEDRRLVASGGRVAPVGGIDGFAVSPDGNAVAYAVYVPGRDQPVFNSLWIESLENETQFQVPIESGTTLMSLRWIPSGLIWETVMTGENGTPEADEPVLYALGPDLRPRLVGGAGATPESATPEASPEAASPAA